ncbi:MAG: hypothetical protein C5B52_08660 [Bacteroidetes bacterium]|nr:MAG: hypothetical protein C5B52_08660 [Bacteroidota bacterium]
MKELHLSETEIQAYVLNSSAIGEESRFHIQHCGICKEEIARYKAVFSTIENQALPKFEFNLEKMVMSQIMAAEKSPAKKGVLVYLITFLAILGIGFTIYYAREYFMDLFWGTPQISIMIITVAASGLIIFQAVDYFRKFRRKLNQLSFN